MARSMMMEPIWFTPKPTKVDRRMWKDDEAPEPDPRIGQAAAQQAALSKESLDWYKSIYASDIAPRANEQWAVAKDVAQSQLQDSAINRERSAEQYKHYTDNFKPIETQMAKEAMDAGSLGDQNRAAGRATSDVQQQFTNASQQSARQLAAMGVNPNSGRFADINSKLQYGQAATAAGAATNAREGARDKGIALRSGAAAFGRNMPNVAGQNLTSAGQAGNNAAGNMGSGMSGTMAGANFMGSGFNTAGGLNAQAGGMYNTAYQNQLGAWSANNANSNGMWSGIGNLAGMAMMAPTGTFKFADGGKIEGAGTGVSDSIPAVNTDNGQAIRVSNGEYIIPADVVRRKGTEFFDKLLEQNHTPAAIQRRKA